MSHTDKGITEPYAQKMNWVDSVEIEGGVPLPAPKNRKSNAIEEGVPIPPTKARYEFEKMKIGDSMYFDDLRAMESAFSAARAYAKRNNNGFKMTSRKLGEESYRLWRIK